MTKDANAIEWGGLAAEGALIGVADAELQISLATPALARYFSVDWHLEGASLIHLIADPESLRALRMLTLGVLSEAVLGTLPPASQLVGEVALVGKERWIMLRHRELRRPTSGSHVRRIGGRGLEMAALDAFILGEGTSIFFIEGPLGIGKTSLLAEYESRCRARGTMCFRLDARCVAPSDSEILAALYPDKESEHLLASIFAAASRLAGRRWVLAIDNFDAWARSGKMPRPLFAHLPEGGRIIVAGRRRPPRTWWGESARQVTLYTLGPLSEVDTHRAALALDIDVVGRAHALRRTLGHPLSIVALTQKIGSEADREAEILDLLTPDSSSTALTRDAVELASLPVRITEDVVAELSEDAASPSGTYDSLTEICVRDPDGVGLRMPPVLRDAVRERLLRRNPLRFAALEARLAIYYAKRVDDGSTVHTRTMVDDLLATLSEHPVASRLFGTNDSAVSVRRASLDELAAIITAASSMADAATAEDIAARMKAEPNITYVAERAGEIVGVVQYAVVSTATVETCERRQAVQTVARRMAEGTVQVAAVLASVLSEEGGTDWGEVHQALSRMLFGLTILSPAVIAAMVVSEPRHERHDTPWATWQIVDGFSIAVRDLRGRSVTSRVSAFLSVTSEAMNAALTAPSAPVVSISVEDVRFALANIDQLDVLATSPLAALEICRGDSPAVQLQAILSESVESLDEVISTRRAYRILHAAFVERRGKHEQIARELGIPYGTFRRQMMRGIEQVRQSLIQRGTARAGVVSGE